MASKWFNKSPVALDIKYLPHMRPFCLTLVPFQHEPWEGFGSDTLRCEGVSSIMAKSAVKNAHTVSKSYIRAWADDRNVVDVIDLQDGRGYPSSYLSATVVRYGYDSEILSYDLEHEYGRIEDRGIPAIVRLRKGYTLTAAERNAVVAFLDMHLDRGRYADQAKTRVPAVVLKTGGRIEHAEMTLGDRLVLSQSLQDVLRLTTLGLEQWPWQVRDIPGLVTGDGAVLLWETTKGAGICTVSFPLSPTQLLVIGQNLPDDVRFNPVLNPRLAENSRRWIVGARGTLNFKHAAVIATGRTQG
ncbi:DUF4238 domain-containing protein [Arthrobacter sp. CAU 1506]|uniref:DUF4238 domain-containing protein n=1 Tax=Arthrobacter sp. CAU 1506 TaxID=2560052 RepID=UPI0010ABCD74|nr:DUF4238 domain-containing protein [Arthrobacter sp. CAU 1506]TJY66200.1 DUF4238 domain-containing protein [Arthrobacter sp. CAU 1506]